MVTGQSVLGFWLGNRFFPTASNRVPTFYGLADLLNLDHHPKYLISH